MGDAWKRVYFDLPAEIHAQVHQRAKELDIAMKVYLANLIIADVASASKKGKKRGSQKDKT